MTAILNGPAGSSAAVSLDLEELRAGLALLLDPDSPHEIRYFGRKGSTGQAGSFPVCLAGIDEAASRIAALASRPGLSFYYTLNPARDGFGSGSATDSDISRRRWLLVDLDPAKAPGFRDQPATDDEHSEALETGRRVAEFLTARGWPDPVVIDSGNGCHLLYRIDLPNDPESKGLVGGVLATLGNRWPAVDTKVHNASRIARLPGTWNRKGTDSPDRPHRICRVLSVPLSLAIVPVEALEALASAGNKPCLAPVVDRQERYLTRALDAEVQAVANAAEGQRNNALNLASFKIGQLLPHGLDDDTARSALLDAAIRAGLPEDEAADTIERALDAGAASPRELPEFTEAKPEAAGANGTGYDLLTDAELGILSADEIEPQNVQPIWLDRVYVGKLNLFVGESGEGKSQTAYRVAAAVTDPAVTMPDGSTATDFGTVLILAPEDGAADTLVPRLKAAGADTSRVKILTAKVASKGADGTPTISFMSFQDLSYWRSILRRLGDVRLLIADPIPSCLGRGVNDYRNQEVRQVLEPFIDLLNEMGVALLGVTHLGKSPDLKNPAHRILGSVAYNAISRSTHFTIRDPDSLDGRRFLTHEKNTYGPSAPSLAFRIEPFEVERRDGEIVKASRVAYEAGTVDANAFDLMNAERTPGKKRGRAPERSSKLAEWLFDYLKSYPAGRLLAAVIDDAGDAGLIGQQAANGRWSGVSALYRAKQRLAELEGDRAGFEVFNFHAPAMPLGPTHLHWGLRPAGSDSSNPAD